MGYIDRYRYVNPNFIPYTLSSDIKSISLDALYRTVLEYVLPIAASGIIPEVLAMAMLGVLPEVLRVPTLTCLAYIIPTMFLFLHFWKMDLIFAAKAAKFDLLNKLRMS